MPSAEIKTISTKEGTDRPATADGGFDFEVDIGQLQGTVKCQVSKSGTGGVLEVDICRGLSTPVIFVMEAWQDATANDDEDELLDYRTSAKDALIILCDATSPMHIKRETDSEADDGEERMTPFEMAIKVAHATLRNKVFHAPNDLVGVMLFGTAKAVEVADFKHISQLLALDTAEAQYILRLEEFLDNAEKFKDEFGGPNDDFSLHEAIWQCQTMFANIKGKTGQNKIMLLTCVDDPHEVSKALQSPSLLLLFMKLPKSPAECSPKEATRDGEGHRLE